MDGSSIAYIIQIIAEVVVHWVNFMRMNNEHDNANDRTTAQFLIYWAANEESLQTKKIWAKKTLCKEKDAKKAKKNIGKKP